MGAASAPRPVKLIAGLLVSSLDLLGDVHAQAAAAFGAIDLASEPAAWTVTSYYRDEMGDSLWRQFLSFATLVDPGRLVEVKRRTNEMEQRWRVEPGRRVNIDPGYAAPLKLVLATTKDAAHRVYLGQGISAEVTLIWERGSYRACAHTYPDYADAGAIAFFNRVRTALKRGD